MAQDVSKSYGDKLLFENINISINKGQKVALIARNGTGKTSLLEALIGLESFDTGKIDLKKDVEIGYLKQSPDYDAESTILESIFSSDNPIIDVIKKYEYLISKADADVEEVNELTAKLDQMQAWDYEARIRQVLGKLQINQLDKKMGELSGGQLKRVSLAAELIKEPNFLILDEPTNHLDIEMIEWLEQYILKHLDSLLLVTHDRYFLDNVTTEILELDGGQLYKYKGDYKYFLEKKTERVDNVMAETDKAKSLMKKELEWIRRSPKARGTKAKARVDNFENIKDKATRKVESESEMLNFKMDRIGKKVLEVYELTKSYDGVKYIDDFTYLFNRYDRIGVIGKNGTGKSTLLDLLTAKIEADSGRIIKGGTINFGYFTQKGLELKKDKKVIEVIQDIAEFIKTKEGKEVKALSLLNRFQFPPPKQQQYVSRLSGGEHRRLHLLTILMQNPNFLILDEPTNDLDLQTLNILEDYLEKYEGCLMIVSHDRYFMDKLVDHVLVFQGEGKIKDYPGNYTDYRNWLKKEAKPAIEKKSVKRVKEEQPKTRMSYNEKREFESLEAELPELEKEKKILEEEINSGISDHELLLEKTTRLGELINTLDEKEMRWLELSEFKK